MSAEAKALVEEAIGVVCTQAKLDPQSSVAIDEMQARPSLPVHSPEARAGAERAQRLLPLAKTLVAKSLRQLAAEYGLQKSPKFSVKINQAIGRINAVRRVRPDMESRDNASVFLSRPRVITFGTLFLAGLRSDEGMISVLAHELMHIADGDNDSLRPLVAAVGNKASDLTGLEVHGQRGEEITCDLIGAMAVRAYVADTSRLRIDRAAIGAFDTTQLRRARRRRRRSPVTAKHNSCASRAESCSRSRVD